LTLITSEQIFLNFQYISLKLYVPNYWPHLIFIYNLLSLL